MAVVPSVRPRKSMQWALGLSAAAAVALLIGWLVRDKAPAAAPAPAQVAAAPAPAAETPLPPSAESDARVREALSGVSPSDLFHRWLASADDLLNRLAVIAVSISEDRSPARELAFLRPSRPFRAVRSGSDFVIAPRAQARYDGFAKAISSLDAERVAGAYRTLHPLLESAYHALGYPGRPLDGVVTRALQRVVDAPVREHVAVQRAGSLWVFADPSLETLGGVEKQFLRMGPRNTRLVQAQAREIAHALGLRLRGPLEATTTR
ncbi:MAG TPA: DUF3014 domain-containing protein [Myxococcales bacterium]|nr:DUF3014 domain-containing protein [Myxococcales bacterium]